MSLFIPFNFQPVSTAGGTAEQIGTAATSLASYTVPANKYSRVTVTTVANVTFFDGDYITPLSMITADSDSSTQVFFLKAGEVLSFSFANSTATNYLDSFVYASIGGTRCIASRALTYQQVTGTSYSRLKSSIYYRAEEFNQL